MDIFVYIISDTDAGGMSRLSHETMQKFEMMTMA